MLGNLLKNEGDRPGARAAYERAIASGLGSRAPEAARDLGVTLLDAGDTVGAAEAFRYAIDSRHASSGTARASRRSLDSG
ncbi:tetratricopeptide repeat protein [Streptomyces sp. NPDC001642]|uniref:tetratricopeptide repeat protein n=1 Tax=Streptomyces sp. NPDC001642 TaxID=3154392 RepID=UPI003332DF4D